MFRVKFVRGIITLIVLAHSSNKKILLYYITHLPSTLLAKRLIHRNFQLKEERQHSMEVDTPPGPTDSGDVEADSEVEDAMKNGLKRSCSAPTINHLFSNASSSSTSSSSSSSSSSCSSEPVHMHMKLRPASYLSASSRWRR
jgi:hypothetical protein